MVKQMLKIAGVKTQNELYKKYPTEAAFFRAHPEAEMLKEAAMGGSYYYADGGGMPPQGGMQQGPPPGAEQGQPQGGGGADEQMQQIVQFIGQALQQGMSPEEIIQKLVEAGLPQDQAQQLVEAVMQQMQGGGGQGGAPQEGGMPPQGPPEEMMQGQEAPPQEMMEGQAPMGMYGGSYGYGGMAPDGRALVNSYGYGGPTRNNSTYSAGMSYANGGPFIPQYGDIAWNVDYASGGEAGAGNQLIMQVAQMLQQGVQPEAILQQLVQAKIPQKKAVKLIEMVMQKLKKAGGAPAGGAAPEQEQAMMAYGGPAYSKVTQYNHQGIVPAFDWMAYGGSYNDGGGYPVTQMTTEDPREAARSYENKMNLYQMNKEIPSMLPTKIAVPDSRFGNTTYPGPNLNNRSAFSRCYQRCKRKH
jgi:transcriptional regulator CtsR